MFYVFFLLHSPSSNLNSKQITSDDSIGNIVSLQGSTGIQTSGARPPIPRDDSSIASGSSGFGSLTKKKPEKPEFYSNEMDPATFISSVVTDSGISESSDAPSYPIAVDTLSNNHNTMLPSSMQQVLTSQTNSSPGDIGHSRNSSNTSQVNNFFNYCP